MILLKRIRELQLIGEYQRSYEKEREEIREYDYELERIDQEQARRDSAQKLEELEQVIFDMGAAEQNRQLKCTERERLNAECNELRSNVLNNDSRLAAKQNKFAAFSDALDWIIENKGRLEQESI